MGRILYFLLILTSEHCVFLKLKQILYIKCLLDISTQVLILTKPQKVHGTLASPDEEKEPQSSQQLPGPRSY